MNRQLLMIAAAALIASHSAVARVGWVSGVESQKARQKAAERALEDGLRDVSAKVRKLQSELVQSEQARAATVERLEDEARNDPDAVGRVPTDDSLQRLNSRWGAD